MSVMEKELSSGIDSAAGVARRFGPREQLVEILVFLFLIGPSMVLSLLFVHTPQPKMAFVPLAVMVILRDLALVALLAYFLWRNGEPISRIGWRLDGFWREIAVGVLLFVPFFFLMAGIERLFLQVGLSQPPHGEADFLNPHGGGQLALASVLTVVVAISEETIFRGYLLLRLSAVSRSMLFAVVFSSVLFSFGHGYEGTVGVATVGVMGMVLAVIYLWRGSLIAPVTMHFLQDFVAIVILSALVSGPPKASQAEVSLHVRNCKEQGTTTMPFDMVAINGLDRSCIRERVNEHP